MRGRRLELGEQGDTETTVQRRSEDGKWTTVPRFKVGDRYRARCRYRGDDGAMREVSRVAHTKVDAVAAVADYFTTKDAATDHLTKSTTVADAGAIWLTLAARSDSGLSSSTVDDYARTFARYATVKGSPIANLTISQLTPANLRTFLQSVADGKGTAAAKMTRSVLAGMIRLAVNDGVLGSNPLLQVGAVKQQADKRVKSKHDHDRALTKCERDALVASTYARVHEPNLHPSTTRKRRTTADLVAFLAGTGARIEEARGTRWDDVDLSKGSVLIRGTKSTAALRRVDLPAWLGERLVARARDLGSEGLLFPAPHLSEPERAWDQSNSAGAVREALDAGGLDWAIPHTFRRTVATVLHNAGVPIVHIADQLGHADPSMTASVYLGRDAMGTERPDLAEHL